ncbi:MAG: sensor histidine kinase, partial [Spirochaetaceae bacterium]|nr:sensor histidine kinase [Spirochaetaceae bacterium]
KLIIQPLVENAVIHGLEKKIGPGLIILEALKLDNNLIIRVFDDGVGMSEPWQKSKKKESNSVGLSNVHRRLELLYGESSGITVESTPGKGTTVTVIIPWISQEWK